MPCSKNKKAGEFAPTAVWENTDRICELFFLWVVIELQNCCNLCVQKRNTSVTCSKSHGPTYIYLKRYFIPYTLQESFKSFLLPLAILRESFKSPTPLLLWESFKSGIPLGDF